MAPGNSVPYETMNRSYHRVMTEWKISIFASRPPALRPTLADGNYLSQGRGIHRRTSFHTEFDAKDWDGVVSCLVEYWTKIAEVLPQFYAGRESPDPLADQPVAESGIDNGWKRIVLLCDPVYGKFTTHLWRDGERPKQCDRVWIICRFPFIDETFDAAFERDENDTTVGEMLSQRMRESLIEAAKDEQARAAIESLQRWRDFEWWTMEYENPSTLQPLFARG